jgi:sugar phosphate isomerase/epimerase
MLAGRRAEDISKRLAQAREAGFSLCQLNLQQEGLSRADLVEIADALLEYGIRPVSIGCYVNPLAPNRPSYLGATRGDLETALHGLDILGARRVVLLSGSRGDEFYDAEPWNETDEALADLSSFITSVVKETKARNYLLVLEPWYCHVLYSVERILQFHDGLHPDVARHVRYVLDAVNLLSPERYEERDTVAASACRALGAGAGVVHLKDIVMPPDGEHAMPPPGLGRLDYAAYVAALHEYAADETPAIVRNVPAQEMAQVRDILLRMSDRWRLA